ncbi:MAG: glycerophosphodiester phosphodiesterase [Sedimentisphaerales bacterium]|nr:glycerophosphodiester phosphodiesterase [Sedimentisphaerales bacterium]
MELILLIAFIAGGCSASGNNHDVRFIAHRGASYLAPENTVASALLAWKLNADAVEVDVYLSQDQRIMVIHDNTTKRTSDVDLKVAQTTAEELRKLDVGSFKSKTYAGEKIPFLEEIIATVPKEKKLFVEVKCGPEIIDVLKQAMEKSGKKDQIIIISFSLDVVSQAKKVMPEIPAYWLIGPQKDEQTQEFLPHDPNNIQIAREHGLDGLDVHYTGVTEAFLQAVKDNNQELYVWTVDDPKEAQRLKNLGVKGITTNRPDWLRKKCNSRLPAS